MPPNQKNEEVTDLLNQLDEATTAAGTRVQAIIDDINATSGAGLTGPQTENVLARLGTLRDHLNAIGTNPTTPVPDVPAEDPDMPT